MKLGITGKVAIVTAASGGLGSAIAHGLAAEGVRVVVFSRSQAALEALASDIEKEHGVRSLAVVGDMCVAADVKRLVRGQAGLGGTSSASGASPRPTSTTTRARRWRAR